MKLLAVVIGFVALASCEVYTSQYYGPQNQGYDYPQLNDKTHYGQYSSDSDLSHHHDQNSHQNKINQRYGHNYQNTQNQNDEYSEYNWDVQSFRYPINTNSQYKEPKYSNQDYADVNNQYGRSQNNGFNNQYVEESNNKNAYSPRSQNYESFFDFSSEDGSFSELNSQEDYIKNDYDDNDAASAIGHNVAHKMIKLMNTIEKYAAHNGTVQTNQAQDPLTLRQWALPMDRHQFLNMNDNKIYGLTQGMIKAMYINTEKNSVDLEYFFSSLLTKGYFKASTGPKGSFNLKMINTFVNVSTELENYNRNYAHSRNGNTEVFYENSFNDQSITENIESQYVQFVNRAIENEMIENSYNGLIGNLRAEIESTIDIPSSTKPLLMENKKSKLTISFLNSQILNNSKMYKQKKVQYFAFRQNKFGTGYKFKVKVILAKEPKWESDIVAQKAHQQININNVNFEARSMYATAIMERVKRPNGEYKFNVEYASVKFDGLKYDIGKFNYNKNSHENLAAEIGQNLQNIFENGMSAAFQQQLYRLQQICQQSSYECTKNNL